MGGQHRAQRAGVMSSAAVVSAAVAIALAGPAAAAQVQPGAVPQSDGAQPGSAPQSDGAQPGAVPQSEGVQPTVMATPPVKPRSYWVAPPPEYDQMKWRSVPSDDQAPSSTSDNSGTSDTSTSDNSSGADTTSAPQQYVAPVKPQELHLPTRVAPTAPIQAPKKTLRLGDFETDQPNWMSDEYLDRTNNTAAVIEAQVNTAWHSIGVPTKRSDRIAAATVGGAATGALAGAAAVGVPAAVVGGLVGGTVGGIGGAAVGTVIPLPVPGVAPITSGVAGTAAGAAAGAAIAGVPAAAAGAVAGGVAGGLAGAAFGAGDTNATPKKVAAPDLPEPNTDAITTQAHDQVASLPQPMQQAVHNAVTTSQQTGTQIAKQAADARTAVAAQPGGKQVLAGLDNASKEARYAFGPVGNMIGKALGAAATGAKK